VKSCWKNFFRKKVAAKFLWTKKWLWKTSYIGTICHNSGLIKNGRRLLKVEKQVGAKYWHVSFSLTHKHLCIGTLHAELSSCVLAWLSSFNLVK
jgi:hypothetical protein